VFYLISYIYILKFTTFLPTFLLTIFIKKYIIYMNNRIPDNEKKLKISISIDPELNRKVDKIIEKKFYKKSRFFEFLIKKYIEDNDNKS
jgi:hypothetical protein